MKSIGSMDMECDGRMLGCLSRVKCQWLVNMMKFEWNWLLSHTVCKWFAYKSRVCIYVFRHHIWFYNFQLTDDNNGLGFEASLKMFSFLSLFFVISGTSVSVVNDCIYVNILFIDTRYTYILCASTFMLILSHYLNVIKI